MTAADFWDSSPRAILTLYDRAKQARKPDTARQSAAASATDQPQRLARLPR